MKIVIIQLNIIWKNKSENLIRAEDFIKQANADGADLVVFPEMFNTGFSMDSQEIAEAEKGETFLVLSSLAKKYKINLIAGLAESSGSLKNIALSINRQGDLLAKYIKNYPFSFAGEDKFYQAGDEQVVFELDGVKCSTFICYDLRFPEVFRGVAKQVEVIFVIANWPASRQLHWQSLLQARAIENQCFVVGVNRTGEDGNGLTYAGGSCIFNPLGHCLLLADEMNEYHFIEIDSSEVAAIRDAFPFLLDMK